MNLGPDQIIACPHCGGYARHITLLSGNTFGTRIWTDGKQISPMLPHPPPLVQCAHCARCYWLGDAAQVGEDTGIAGGSRRTHPEWADASYAKEPDEAEYYTVIEGGLAEDRVQERNLRILAWWRHNDPYRSNPPETTPLSDACRINMEHLVALLDDEDDSDLLMRAELLRELGRFDQARYVLDTITSSEVAPIVRGLQSLCERHDVCVRELGTEEG